MTPPSAVPASQACLSHQAGHPSAPLTLQDRVNARGAVDAAGLLAGVLTQEYQDPEALTPQLAQFGGTNRPTPGFTGEVDVEGG